MSFSNKHKFVDYKSIANSYADYGLNAITDWELGFNKIYDYISPVSGKSILDYGCGDGKFCRFLAEQGANVMGVDISPELITIANKNKCENIEYHRIRSGEMSFLKSDTIDHSVMAFVLCTLNIKKTMIKILQEINRVMKKNGLLIMLSVNWEKSNGKEFISFKPDNVENLVSGKKLNVLLKSEQPLIVQEYFWPISFYCELLTESGFIIEKIDEPIIVDDDPVINNYNWMDEINSPPFSIIVAKKEK